MDQPENYELNPYLDTTIVGRLEIQSSAPTGDFGWFHTSESWQ